MNHHILLLEDDASLARLTVDLLQQEGYVVSWCSNALRARQLLNEQHVDLVLCDVMLPGMNGFDFVSQIRADFVGPVLFMTAQTKLQHQLHGLEIGAQDYLVKPVDPRLLLAKVKVFLPKMTPSVAATTSFSQHNLTLDTTNKTATLQGQVLDLTSAEFKLLAALMAQFGKVVSRDWLFQQQLGRPYDGADRTMDGRASRLRKKLQAIDLRWNVVTAWGEGYYLSFDGARPEQGATS